MEKFFQQFGKSRLPSLILVGIFFYTGADLVHGANLQSVSGVSGSILLLVGVIFSFFAFADYRYKEHTDFIFGQHKQTIEVLSKALKSTGNTHNIIEKQTQTSLKNSEKDRIGKEGQKQYSIEDSEETLTQ